MTIYPDHAGFKGHETSEIAANRIEPKAKKLRERVLDAYRREVFGMTADECAERLGEHILSIRPRVSELTKRGLLEDTGRHHPNRFGSLCTVLRARA